MIELFLLGSGVLLAFALFAGVLKLAFALVILPLKLGFLLLKGVLAAVFFVPAIIIGVLALSSVLPLVLTVLVLPVLLVVGGVIFILNIIF